MLLKIITFEDEEDIEMIFKTLSTYNNDKEKDYEEHTTEEDSTEPSIVEVEVSAPDPSNVSKRKKV